MRASFEALPTHFHFHRKLRSYLDDTHLHSMKKLVYIQDCPPFTRTFECRWCSALRPFTLAPSVAPSRSHKPPVRRSSDYLVKVSHVICQIRLRLVTPLCRCRAFPVLPKRGTSAGFPRTSSVRALLSKCAHSGTPRCASRLARLGCRGLIRNEMVRTGVSDRRCLMSLRPVRF